MEGKIYELQKVYKNNFGHVVAVGHVSVGFAGPRGVVGASGLAQNEASKTFLQKGASSGSCSWSVLKVFGVSVVVGILLLAGIAMYRSNKNQKRELPQKEKIKDTKLNPEKISDKEVCNQVDILISEIQNLKPEGFFKGEDFLNDAKERNNKLVDSLKAKSLLFSNKDLDKLFEELKVSAGNMLREEVNKQANCTKKIKDYQSFLNEAKEAYDDLENVRNLSSKFLVKPRIFVSKNEEEEWEKVAKEKVLEVRPLLKKWYRKEGNSGLDFYSRLNENEYDEISKKNLEENIIKIYRQLRHDSSPYLLSDKLLLELEDYLSTLADDIKEIEKKLKEWKAPLDTAVKKFDKNKQEIVKALTNIKEEKKKKGISGSLWGSNRPVLNEADA